MANKKYEELAGKVVDLVGGVDNVTFLTHCVTRLRFNVKDRGLVQDAEVAKLPGVLTEQWVGDQYQVVIGNAVGDVYQMLLERYPTLSGGGSVPEDAPTGEKQPFSINTLFDIIAGCVTPLISVIIGAGMLRMVMIVCNMTGILTPESTTYQVLDFVADSAFYFMPVFVGGFAARKFNVNMGLGMVVGAMLIHPNFIAAVNGGTQLSVFGLPIYPMTYTSQIIPSILAAWVMSYVEKFFNRHTPDMVRAFMAPFLTLLVMIPVTLCALAPLGAVAGNYFTAAILWLHEKAAWIAMPILVGLMPLIVMTGMHMALNAACMQFLAAGADPFIIGAFILSNMDQGAACLAVALKTKNAELRSEAITCGITAIFGGVTEPAMYGVTLKHKTPLYGAIIGSVVAGLVAGIGGSMCYAFAGVSIFGLPGFIDLAGGGSSLIPMIIAVAAGMAVTFAATLFLYKDDVDA